MKLSMRIAAVALLGATGMTATMIAVPAQAATKEAPKAPPIKVSKTAAPLLGDAQKLLAAGDSDGALAKLSAAEALPDLTPTDKYWINAVKRNIAIGKSDHKMLEQAIRAQLDSGVMPAEDLPTTYRGLAQLALEREDYATATTMIEQLVKLNPNDPDINTTLAELYQRQKQPAKAAATLGQVIDTSKANGQMASEAVYRRRFAIAYAAKLPETQADGMALVAAYPTPTNWRDSLTLFRESQKMDDQGNLDIMRLMQTIGALNGERDYAEYAETATNRGLPGEGKMVLDEGIAKKMLDPQKPFVRDMQALITPKLAADKASLPGLAKDAAKSPTGKAALITGDAMYGYGQYTEAAEMYRLALSKSGIDADVANTRLGMVLAKTGDKAGAIAAFKTVKGPGPRLSIAQYWLIYLKA
jgi:tetratricopeptide (TPR) repeat protein